MQRFMTDVEIRNSHTTHGIRTHEQRRQHMTGMNKPFSYGNQATQQVGLLELISAGHWIIKPSLNLLRIYYEST
jgi:hypothetical protein